MKKYAPLYQARKLASQAVKFDLVKIVHFNIISKVYISCPSVMASNCTWFIRVYMFYILCIVQTKKKTYMFLVHPL